MSHTVIPVYDFLGGRVTQDIMESMTPGISHYAQFRYHKAVWYLNLKDVRGFPEMGGGGVEGLMA